MTTLKLVTMQRPAVPNEFDSLMADLPVAAYRTTLDGRIVARNAALARLLGVASVECLDSIDVRSLCVNPHARRQVLERSSTSIDPLIEEIENRRIDG